MGIWYAYKNLTAAGVKPYAGNCPPYYELKGKPWFDELTRRIPELKQKTIELLLEKKVDLPQFLGGLVQEGRWESKAFLAWNVRRKLADAQGSEVFACIKDIPGVVSLFISVLKPGTRVKPHNGDTDATYRLHIPIVIPTGLPACGIKVNGEERAWPDNEIVTFCDAHMHEVWNETDQQRVILILDVVREEYQAQQRAICTRVLSWIFVQKVFDQKIVSVMPTIIKGMIGYPLLLATRPIFRLLQQRQE